MNFSKGLPRPAKDGEWVSIDLEIFKQEEGRLHRPTGFFACASIAFKDTVYQVHDLADLKEAIDRVRPGLWIFQNGLYDIQHLRRWVKVPQRKVWDTLLVERAMFGGYYNAFSLDALARRYLGIVLEKDTRYKFGKTEKMTPDMERYAAMDAWATLQVADKQQEYLNEIDDDLFCYWGIDEPAIWSFADIQPVKINVDGWLKMVAGFKREGERMEQELDVNVYSHAKVKELIKSQAGEEVANTNAKETLEPLVRTLQLQGKVDEAALIEKILLARTMRKAAETYGENWIDKSVEEGDLVYGGWIVTGAETGRSACSDPNLMNIPVRKTPEYRNQFISKHKQGRILVADVNAQEPRITAALSGDEEMLRVFHEGKENIYVTAASTCYVDKRKHTKNRGKPIVLGSIYGLSPYGLALQSDLNEKEAEDIQTKFFHRFRGVSTWIDKTRSQAKSFGFVKTASGRRYWINEHHNRWMRNAINSPIQGSAGDHIKMAMNYIHEATDIPYSLIMEVHDELVADVPPGLMPQIRPLVKEAWIEAGKKLVPQVPMVVDIKTGNSWGVKQ